MKYVLTKGNMGKRILIDGRLLSGKPTGISRYTQELIASYCLQYGKDSVSVIISENHHPGITGLKYYTTKLKPFNIADFLRFSLFLKKIDFDLFHAPFYANSFFKVPGRIYITTIHDLMYRVIKNFFSTNHLVNFLAVTYYDFIVKRSLANSDLLISVSKTTAEDVSHAFHQPSIHIPEGVNSIYQDAISQEEEMDYLSANGLSAGQYFLYVGNLRNQKNIPFMLRAFAASGTSKKLVIAGNYPLSDQQKYDTGTDPRILFSGYASDRELAVLYRNCAAFIYPSVYEGFGLPVLEALNYHVKVFSSNGGALKEFPDSVVHFFDPEHETQLTTLIDNESDYSVNKSEIDVVLTEYNWQFQMGKMHREIVACITR